MIIPLFRTTTYSVAAIATLTTALPAAIMYIHDSTGSLGTVDTDSGAVEVIGDMGVTMTDIAFDTAGELYGITFSGLYTIDPTTASTALVGGHGVPGGNALVFGADGTLYSAGSSSTDLYSIDPGSGATASLGTTGFASGGDLAFVDDAFFLATSGFDLVSVDLANPPASSVVGPFGINDVYGIATDAADIMYGVGGTELFTVDLATGAALDAVDFGGQGLGPAFSQSFFAEAGAPGPGPDMMLAPVPLPASAALLIGAFGVTGAVAARRRRAS